MADYKRLLLQLYRETDNLKIMRKTINDFLFQFSSKQIEALKK